MKDTLKTTIFAPGKLLISGEYSVLEGYEAIVSATNKFYCHSVPAKKFTILDHNNNNIQININKKTIKIDELYSKKLYLVKLILETAIQHKLKIPKIKIKLDSKEFYIKDDNNNKKIGLGSSSALSTALSYQIIFKNYKQIKTENVFSLAYKSHKKYTNNISSGIDIAASVFGGLILFKKYKNEYPKITRLKLNKAINNILCVYSGYPQETKYFLDAIEYLKTHQINNYNNIMKKLNNINKILSKEIMSINTEISKKLIFAVNRYSIELYTLGILAKINILSKSHIKIINIAQKYGGAAKPSGAGGGDISIAFLHPKKKKQFINEIQNNGFIIININFCTSGVSLI